jgi:hypothetical protein
MRFAPKLSALLLYLAGSLGAREPERQVPLFFVSQDSPGGGPCYTVRLPGARARFEAGGYRLRFPELDVRLSFEDSSPDAIPEGAGALPGKVNFLAGPDPRQWRTGVAAYSSIVYRGLYPGIDAVYRGDGARLKADFIVRPRADPSRIRLRYSHPVHIDAAGALVVSTGAGELREDAPFVYQDRAGARVAVPGSYTIRPDGAVGFQLGAYDPELTLVIDPSLSYSTFLGGSGLDAATSVAVDAGGNAYIAGWTESGDFPTQGPRQGQNLGGVDAFVVKLSPNGGSLVYATYMGGRGDDRALGIAVNAAGAAHVCGRTSSINFPILSAAQTSPGGGRDGWVAKLNPAGNALVYSTYYGGALDDSANGIAVDAAGNAYVTGETNSPDFRVVSAYQNSARGGQDAFAVKFGPSGAVIYSTFLGGAGDDRGAAVAVDASGNAYFTGGTDSLDFPVLGAVQPVNGGGQDAFVVKLGPSGTFAYGTFLGGSSGSADSPEAGAGISLDAVGSIHVTGSASSSNFPRANAPASVLAGVSDCFAAKLNAAGTTLVYSTLFGGASADYCSAIAVSSGGVAYVAGYTASRDLPVPGAVQGVNAGGIDAFVARFAANGTLDFATYLGGSGHERAAGVAADSSGGFYVVGQTQSINFQLKNAVQTYNGGHFGAFAVKYSGTSLPGTVSVTPSSGSGSSQTFSFVFTNPAGSAGIDSVEILFNSTTTASNACFLRLSPSTNILALFNDDGNLLTGNYVGAAGVIENSRCAVDTALASVSTSGLTLTLNVNVAFKPVFVGSWNLFALVYGASRETAGWQQRGT